jgi:hypothetical protein
MRIARRQMDSLLQASPKRWLQFVCASLEDAYPMSPLFAPSLDERGRLLKAADFCDRARANGLRTDAEILGFVFLKNGVPDAYKDYTFFAAANAVSDKSSGTVIGKTIFGNKQF